MEKFKCWSAGSKIEAIEVLGQTESFVKLPNGRKDAKRSSGYNYFDTFQEAKEFLIRTAENKVESLRLQLERANMELDRVRGIKES